MSNQETIQIDVVIPVYKPGKEFGKLIRRLQMQSLKVGKIFLMHTKDGMDLVNSEWLSGYDNIVVQDIEPEEFDHGGTRDMGIRLSDADYVLCMTQDAIPVDPYLTSELVKALEENKAAVAYARQLPKKDCRLLESYTRSFNYPEKSMVKEKKDLMRLGIKTYFCSNVCAMYRKEIYIKQGGFEKKTIFNEDMIYAAGCIQSGYRIAYAADAKVFHSHNYTNREQFHRNFDLAVSQAKHPDIFESVKSESEGIKMVKSTAVYLFKNKKPWMITRLIVSSGAKYLGYFMGKRYERLPRKIVLKCTMNPRYWG